MLVLTAGVMIGGSIGLLIAALGFEAAAEDRVSEALGRRLNEPEKT